MPMNQDKVQSFDIERLREWFFSSRRFLPWRENPSPYEVWVSEVMLQQTQVSVVIPYFQKWMTLFPTISGLAKAPIEKVIKAWEGLGYYSRARNLHAGAGYLMKHHNGELPSSYEALKKIKGLGPYTIGAILSFAFKQKEVAVDGNVFRVLARLFCIEEEVDKVKTQREMRKLCETLLPNREPWIIMEALIELGALVCQKKPKCFECPLKESCLGKSKAALLPIKRKQEKIISLYRDVAVIYAEGELLLKRGERGKVMADLLEFPYFEGGIEIGKELGLSLKSIISLPEVVHGFTKYKAHLYPHLYQTVKKEVVGYEWISFHQVKDFPFSSGHRRILLSLRNNQILPI